ncbi:MAG: sodium:proton antiporter [Candidatus Competibacterales bacterium]|nr:sodium:proton antiporter [Candidatus Competibacterales bacterium]
MGLLDLAALLVSLAAVFAWINHRYLHLPTTIGVMVVALGISLLLLLVGHTLYPGAADWAGALLREVDFSATVLEGMLSFLLFAGAMFVNLDALRERRYIVAALASVGVLLSTVIVATLTWLLFTALGIPLPYVVCLLFGALISPTDPIAVLGILKTAGVPKSLETKIVGESLFNDGIAVVLFLVLLEVVTTGHFDPGAVAVLFVQEALGGALFGLAIGLLVHWMLSRVDQYQVEILLTLGLVMGGYALASALHLSGPIAMVVSGLLLGNHGRVRAMSARTREHLDQFWELLDEILNAVLFVLIGLEVLALSFSGRALLAGLLVIPIVLLARLGSVSLPVYLLRPFREFSTGVIGMLTWGGLRGGISVALALTLPAGETRDLLLPVTYVVVLFSLLVQGLTVGRLARRLSR